VTTGYDVSRVPLQGGYVAKRCPVRAQNDVLVPADPVPTPAALQLLFDRGNEFEAGVIAEMRELASGCVFIEGHRGAEAEAATLAAMRAGAPIIFGGRLPSDLVGRRVGRPDLLVLAAGGGYRPVDIKYHGAIAPAPPGRAGLPALLAGLGEPLLEDAAVDSLLSAKKNADDLFQLAHYQRMLEAMGMAAEDGRWGGIIGTERQVVWYDLDLAIWRTPSVSEGTKLRSTMERYDFEFDFRLDIIAVAQRAEVDAGVTPLVVPVKIAECESCPWWEYCRVQLERPPGDVSLLPRVGWNEWRTHREHGITNRAQLAALDPLTARIVGAGIDVPGIQQAAVGFASESPISELGAVWTKGKQIERIETLGIATVRDLFALDLATSSYAGSCMWGLADQIDQARAAIGPEPVYRRRGIAKIEVRRADIEVDVDMENIWEGCYLWGALVTDRSGRDIAPSGYRAFTTWDPMTLEVEVENSLVFWRWLMQLRTVAREADLIFAAYCWNANAENTYLRRLGIAAGIENEIETFIASEDWIDMLAVWNRHLITGGSSSLKVVAPLVGFGWSVEDAGGAESMLQYTVALAGGDDVDAARRWLLTYNQGDVEATLAVRKWMGSATLAGVEDWHELSIQARDTTSRRATRWGSPKCADS
jgi:predicted RecB family nuclease